MIAYAILPPHPPPRRAVGFFYVKKKKKTNCVTFVPKKHSLTSRQMT